jgi:hypothetical protein
MITKIANFNTKPPAAARCRIITCSELFEKEKTPGLDDDLRCK